MYCQMPILDGYEATRQIHSLQTDALPTPILAVTASAMKSDAKRCLAAGMDDYLPKPLSLEALAAMLDRWAPDLELSAPTASWRCHTGAASCEYSRTLFEVEPDNSPRAAIQDTPAMRRAAASTSSRRNRRWPPSVTTHGNRPFVAHRLIVLGDTWRRRATSPGVR